MVYKKFSSQLMGFVSSSIESAPFVPRDLLYTH